MKYTRIFVIVIDSLGIGNAPDAKDFGDQGANTFAHIKKAMPNLKIPHLTVLGLKDLVFPVKEQQKGYALSLQEKGRGKDTLSGHWEMMGLAVDQPFQTFPNGFPKELIDELSRRCDHRKIIGNKAASGTQILEELGEKEIQEGSLIVYTSSDSVLQICGNEETMGLETLYRYCEIARELTQRPQWKVGRVIARPYVGKKKGEFVRTAHRHDYALAPFGKTALDSLKEHGLDVIGIGKIHDIFAGQGITQSFRSQTSVQGMEQTIEWAKKEFTGLCYVNLVDFDALWGHRRDPIGYGKELEMFDLLLGELIDCLSEEDLLMITADHGNDPTFKGTDHTRENVSLLMYSSGLKNHGILPGESSFGCVGATILENFGLAMPEGTCGKSLFKHLK